MDQDHDLDLVYLLTKVLLIRISNTVVVHWFSEVTAFKYLEHYSYSSLWHRKDLDHITILTHGP